MLVSRRDCRYRRLAHRSLRVGSGKVTFHAKPGTSSVRFPAYLLPLLTGWPRTRISRNSAAEQGESARKVSLCHNVAIIPGASGLQDPSATPFLIPRTGTLFTRGVRGSGSSAKFALRDSHKFGCTSCVAPIFCFEGTIRACNGTLDGLPGGPHGAREPPDGCPLAILATDLKNPVALEIYLDCIAVEVDVAFKVVVRYLQLGIEEPALVTSFVHQAEACVRQRACL
jgi:hypothetical protein